MNLEASQQVNTIGKYLYRHIDGSFKIKFSRPNTCDVYFHVYYQDPGKVETFNKIDLDINITTYQNKIRINLIEMTDMEKCIGQDIYKPGELHNLDEAFPVIYEKLVRHTEKEYESYDFVY